MPNDESFEIDRLRSEAEQGDVDAQSRLAKPKDRRRIEGFFAMIGGTAGFIGGWCYFTYGIKGWPPELTYCCAIVLSVCSALMGQIVGTIFCLIAKVETEEDISKSEPRP